MPSLRLRLIPRDESFYELFVRLAREVEKAAHIYESMVTEFDDLPRRAHELQDVEHEGDEITHEVMRRLNTVFVTPLDHEDIHRLASRLDDVLDHIEAAGDLIVLHGIEEPLPDMKAQADVLRRAATTVREAMEVLPKFKKLPAYWLEINSLENEGDRIYRRSVAHLFSGDHRAMDVLKWKDIIDEAEAAIDQTEDVANLLEAIALKQS